MSSEQWFDFIDQQEEAWIREKLGIPDAYEETPGWAELSEEFHRDLRNRMDAESAERESLDTFIPSDFSRISTFPHFHISIRQNPELMFWQTAPSTFTQRGLFERL